MSVRIDPDGTVVSERRAVISGGSAERVAAYLPTGYRVLSELEDGRVVIGGSDNAGWTLDGYVLPRLASGLMFGEELES